MKLSDLTNKELKEAFMDEDLAICPKCHNMVSKKHNYCGFCRTKLNVDDLEIIEKGNKKITGLTANQLEMLFLDGNFMLCHNCKSLIRKTDSYCGFCGNSLLMMDSVRTEENS